MRSSGSYPGRRPEHLVESGRRIGRRRWDLTPASGPEHQGHGRPANLIATTTTAPRTADGRQDPGGRGAVTCSTSDAASASTAEYLEILEGQTGLVEAVLQPAADPEAGEQQLKMPVG